MERLQSAGSLDSSNRWRVSTEPTNVEDHRGLQFCSSSGSATTTAPSSWTNSSLEGIFNTKYTKTISTYWPYNTTSTDSSTTSTNSSTTTHHKKFPTWAAAVIGVLCGLLVIGLILLAWFCLRRRQRRQLEKQEDIHETDGREHLTSMYGGGPTSPIAGPRSASTGQETSVGVGTIQDSLDTSASPGTVESGGGAVHEMHGTCSIHILMQCMILNFIRFFAGRTSYNI